MNFKIILLLLAASCSIVTTAPKRKPKKKPAPTAIAGTGEAAAAAGEIATMVGGFGDAPLNEPCPEVIDAQGLAILQAPKEGFLILTREKIAEYIPGVRTFIARELAPKGFRLLTVTGGMSREDIGNVKHNQLASAGRLKRTVGRTTQNWQFVVEEMNAIKLKDSSAQIREKIKQRFSLLKPKLEFGSATFSSEKNVEKLLLEIIDFSETIAWFTSSVGIDSAELSLATQQILIAVHAFFGITKPEDAMKELTAKISAVTALTLQETVATQALVSTLGGTTPTRKIGDISAPEQIRHATVILSESVGPIMDETFYPECVRNKAFFESTTFDDSCWYELAQKAEISDIDKKNPSILKGEVKAKIAHIIATFAATISAHLQDQFTAGNPIGREAFELYLKESLRILGHNPAITDVFAAELRNVSRIFPKTTASSFDFIRDALTITSMPERLFFCLCARTVVPPESLIINGEMANFITIFKRINAFFREKELLFVTELMPYLHGELPPEKKASPLRRKHRETKSDVTTIPSRRDERELPYCEDISQFKLVLPKAKLGDLSKIPAWMSYVAKNFSSEASFFNEIINSAEMFNYKYLKTSTDLSLTNLESLCRTYKAHTDEQDKLLDGRPGLSVTRLMAIFSSLKHLIFEGPKINLSTKLALWNSVMEMDLKVTDLLQAEAWLTKIDPSFKGIQFAEDESEEDEEPSLFGGAGAADPTATDD